MNLAQIVITFPAVTRSNDTPDRIRDWPKLGISIRPEVKRQLEAIAQAQNRSVWQVVQDAIADYRLALPPDEVQNVEHILDGREAVPSATIRIEVPREATAAIEAFLRCWFSPSNEVEESARVLFGSILRIPVPGENPPS